MMIKHTYQVLICAFTPKAINTQLVAWFTLLVIVKYFLLSLSTIYAPCHRYNQEFIIGLGECRTSVYPVLNEPVKFVRIT